LLIESREEAIKADVRDILSRCRNVLKKGMELNAQALQDIKLKMLDAQKERMDNFNVHQADERSSNLTRAKDPKAPRSKYKADFNDFKWMLSAMALMASFYNCLGYQTQCEEVYVEYVGLIEEFYDKDSHEAGNSYFMIGVYYFEQEQLQKSLACFIKALYIRKKDLGEMSLGAADCHYNMGILYKKLNVPSRALFHYEKALEIRREQIGPLSLPVSNILEQLGKFHLESGDYKQSYSYLHECYVIRKKLLSVSNSNLKKDKTSTPGQESFLPNDSPEITRVSVLMLYLH